MPTENTNLSNKYFIDGIDLWSYLGVVIEKGSLDDFLRYAKRKESITHNWKDENGLDVDTSRVYLEARDISIVFFIIADNEANFWLHYDQFIALLARPGERRFSVTDFNRDYFVIFKECSTYDKLTHFKNSTKLFCRFNLKLLELKPSLAAIPEIYITDHQGRFLIT